MESTTTDSNNHSIKHWALDDRPREKLLHKGKETLSNAELIAIIIGSGTPKETAVDVSKKILHAVNNNLKQLAQMSVQDLCKFNGIGPAKAIGIITAMEIARRCIAENPAQKPKITNSHEAYLIFSSRIGALQHEEFWAMYLNNNNQVVQLEQISKGGITQTTVDIRIILKAAIQHHATSLIVAHNHPSGNLAASQQDIQLTKKIKQACDLIEIPCLDHLIINQKDYFSFADNQLL